MTLLLLLDDSQPTVTPPQVLLPVDKREAQNWQSRQGNYPICVVEHISVAPNFNGLVSYLSSANAPQVSVQFVIGGDYLGQIALLVGSGDGRPLQAEKLLRAANHCGIQSFPNNNPRPNVHNSNWFTWGKEHVGYPGQVWSDIMLQNDLKCNDYVRSILGDIGFTYITGHHDFDPINRAHCPGPTFPWRELYPPHLGIMDSYPAGDNRAASVMQRIPQEELESLPIGDHDAFNKLLKGYMVAAGLLPQEDPNIEPIMENTNGNP